MKLSSLFTNHKGNLMNIEQAKEKAITIKEEIKLTESYITEVEKIIPLLDSFDGKVLNVRFEKFIEANSGLSVTLNKDGKISFGISRNYKYMSDIFVHCGLFDYSGGQKAVRAYDAETNRMTNEVFLLQEDGKRINIAGWKEVLHGSIALMEHKISYKKPYVTGKAILTASNKSDAIKDKIRELEKQANEAYPSFLK